MPRQCADVFRSWSSLRYLNCPKNASSVSRKIAGSAPTLYASTATCVAKSMDWVPAWMTIASSGFACKLSRMMLRAMFGMRSPVGYRAPRLYRLRHGWAARSLMPLLPSPRRVRHARGHRGVERVRRGACPRGYLDDERRSGPKPAQHARRDGLPGGGRLGTCGRLRRRGQRVLPHDALRWDSVVRNVRRPDDHHPGFP